ncbi:MAG: response regulator, partial [Vibrionaceae bacterium]
EDNPINQLVISQQLTSFGLSVELVNNGQEAYERLQKGAEQFDLLLTDCHMPVMDGYELATLVRDHLPQFSNHAIIGCTAEDSRVANERAMLSGFDSVLYKPYGLQRLYQTVAQFVPKRAENAPAMWWQNYEMQDAEMLVEVFITSMNDDLMALQTKRTDRKAIHDLAHRIKGGAGTVGDQKICVAATQLENRSKQGEQSYDAELKQLVAAMTFSIHRAEVWLNEH